MSAAGVGSTDVLDGGTVELQAEANTKGFGERLKAAIDKEAKNVAAKVGISFDDDGLKTKLVDAVNDAARGVAAKVRVEFDSAQVARELRLAVAEAQTGVTASVGTEVDHAALRDKLIIAAKEASAGVRATIGTDIDRASTRAAAEAVAAEATETVAKSPFWKRIFRRRPKGGSGDSSDPDLPDAPGGSMGFGGGRGRGQMARQILKYISMASLVQPLISALGAGIGSLVVMAGNLASSLATLSVLPLVLSGLGIGLGTMILAFAGLTGETKDMSKEMRVARKAFASLKDEWKAVKTEVQNNFWKQFADQIRPVGEKLLPQLQSGLGAVATELGKGGLDLANWLGSTKFAEDFAVVIQSLVGDGQSKGMLENLRRMLFGVQEGGDAASQSTQGLVQFLSDLFVATKPLSDRFGTLLAKFGQWTGSLLDSEPEVTKFQNFLTYAADKGGQAARIIGDIASALGGILSAGRPTGDSLLSSFESAISRFDDWVNGPGYWDIREFFESIEPAARALGGLFIAIGKGLTDLVSDPNTTDFINKLANDVLPALVDALISLGDELGPAVLDLLAEFVETLSHLAQEGSPLSDLFSVIGTFFEGLNWVFNESPELAKFVSGVVVALLMLKGLKGLGGPTGVFAGLTAMFGALGKGGAGGKNPLGAFFGGGVQQVMWTAPLPVTVMNWPPGVLPGGGGGSTPSPAKPGPTGFNPSADTKTPNTTPYKPTPPPGAGNNSAPSPAKPPKNPPTAPVKPAVPPTPLPNNQKLPPAPIAPKVPAPTPAPKKSFGSKLAGAGKGLLKGFFSPAAILSLGGYYGGEAMKNGKNGAWDSAGSTISGAAQGLGWGSFFGVPGMAIGAAYGGWKGWENDYRGDMSPSELQKFDKRMLLNDVTKGFANGGINGAIGSAIGGGHGLSTFKELGGMLTGSKKKPKNAGEWLAWGMGLKTPEANPKKKKSAPAPKKGRLAKPGEPGYWNKDGLLQGYGVIKPSGSASGVPGGMGGGMGVGGSRVNLSSIVNKQFGNGPKSVPKVAQTGTKKALSALGVFGKKAPRLMGVDLATPVSKAANKFASVLPGPVQTGLTHLGVFKRDASGRVNVDLAGSGKRAIDGLAGALPGGVQSALTNLGVFKTDAYGRTTVDLSRAGSMSAATLRDSLPAPIATALDNMGVFKRDASGRTTVDLSRVGSVAGTTLKSMLPSGVQSALGALGLFKTDASGRTTADLSGASSTAVSTLYGSLPSGVQRALAALGAFRFGAFSAVAVDLYSAGRSIIAGLVSGILSKYRDVVDAAKLVGQWIRANKGPIEYDRVMLTPAGQAIIDGLIGGLESKYPDVKKSLRAFTHDLSGATSLQMGYSLSATNGLRAGAGTRGLDQATPIQNVFQPGAVSISNPVPERASRSLTSVMRETSLHPGTNDRKPL